jgi:peptidoglycan hydrolase FlgJ
MEIPQLPATAIANPAERTSSRDEAAIRQMATEFEALLLNQLTASLSKTENDEGGLFSDSGGGLSLSRQMFSEQLAKSMAQNGGIGLADLIISQIQQNKSAGIKSPSPASLTREVRNTPATVETATASPTEAQPEGRFIASEAALATRPRRVFPVRTERAAAKNASSEGPGTVSLTPTLTSNHEMLPVSLKLPTRGAIRSGFGTRRDPIHGRPRFHKGIDIAAPSGTPIQAAAAGTVVFAGRNKGYGNMVMIEHADGRRTLYAHARQLFVTPGERVTAGQTIAAVGSTGRSTGPHVHFEIRVGDQAVNPLNAMAKDLLVARR